MLCWLFVAAFTAASPRHSYLPEGFAPTFGWREAGAEADDLTDLEHQPAGGGGSGGAAACNIDRRSSISKKEFERSYLHRRPLIITANDRAWVRRGRWNREVLLRKLGNSNITFGSAAKIALFMGRGYDGSRSLARHVSDAMRSGEANTSGNAYAVDADFFTGHPSTAWGPAGEEPPETGAVEDPAAAVNAKVRAALFSSLRFPPALQFVLEDSARSGRRWPEKILHLGASGTGVAPHWHGDSAVHLVHGRKRWLLFPPAHTPIKVDSYSPVSQRQWLRQWREERAALSAQRRGQHEAQSRSQRPPPPPPLQPARGARGGSGAGAGGGAEGRAGPGAGAGAGAEAGGMGTERSPQPPPPPPPPPARGAAKAGNKAGDARDAAGADAADPQQLEERRRWELAAQAGLRAEAGVEAEEEAAMSTWQAPLECVQQPGEVLYVPDSWVHATVNIGETVSVSTQRHPAPDGLLWQLQLAVVGDGGGAPSIGESARAMRQLSLQFGGNMLVLFTLARVLGLAVQQGKVVLPALERELEQRLASVADARTTKSEGKSEGAGKGKGKGQGKGKGKGRDRHKGRGRGEGDSASANFTAADERDRHRMAMLRRQGDVVVANFRRASRLCPRDSDSLYGLGEMCMFLGRKNEAHDALVRAESLAPLDPYIQAGLVHASRALGHEAEVARRSRLHRKNAQTVASALRVFRNLTAAGNTSEALELIDTYVLHNPSDKSLLRELQGLLQQMHDQAHGLPAPIERMNALRKDATRVLDVSSAAQLTAFAREAPMLGLYYNTSAGEFADGALPAEVRGQLAQAASRIAKFAWSPPMSVRVVVFDCAGPEATAACASVGASSPLPDIVFTMIAISRTPRVRQMMVYRRFGVSAGKAVTADALVQLVRQQVSGEAEWDNT
eukprot:g1221.t1